MLFAIPATPQYIYSKNCQHPQKNDYNPWHRHLGNTISTIFVLSGAVNEMKTQFKNPIYDMKNPQGKVVKHDREDVDLFNE